MGALVTIIRVAVGYLDILYQSDCLEKAPFPTITILSDEDDNLTNGDIVIRKRENNHRPPDENYGFHAAWNKTEWLLEGLKIIKDPGWVIFMDADIVLPKDSWKFLHQTLLRMQHDKSSNWKDYIYGLAGRRILTYSAVQKRNWNPQDVTRHFLERYQTVIGYFQMFWYEGAKGRLFRTQDSVPISTEGHDDWKFWNRFSVDRNLTLPIGCIHIGNSGRNWGGVVEPKHDHTFAQVHRAEDIGRVWKWFAEYSKKTSNQGSIGIQLGYEYGDTTICLSAICDKLYLVDRFRLQCTTIECVDDLPEWAFGVPGWKDGAWKRLCEARRDRIPAPQIDQCVNPMLLTLIKWERESKIDSFREQVRELKNLQYVEQTMPKNRREVKDSSVDIIWIDGEVTPSVILRDLPAWLPKLKMGGYICGAYCDVNLFPTSTHLIYLTLGSPDIQFDDGTWCKRITERSINTREGERNCFYPWKLREDVTKCFTERGIVLFCRNSDDFGKLASSLHGLRKHWRGAVSVLYYGKGLPSLEILAARYEAFWVQIPMSEEKNAPRVVRIEEISEESLVTEWSPFKETLWIRSGFIANRGEVASGFMKARHSKGIAILPDSKLFSPDCLDRELSLQVLRANSSPINANLDDSVIIFVGDEDVDGFIKLWNSIEWPNGLRIIVAVSERFDTWKSEIYNFPESTVFIKVSSLYIQGEFEPSLVVELADRMVETKRWIYLDPMVHAAPGAELFVQAPFREIDVLASGWTFRKVGERERQWQSRVRHAIGAENDIETPEVWKHFQLEAPGWMARTECSSEAFQIWQELGRTIPFSVVFNILANYRNWSISTSRLTDYGWSF